MAAPNCPDGDSLRVTETKTVSTTFEWTIKSLKSHVKTVGCSLKSNPFSMKSEDPITWYLVIYPNGNRVENTGLVSIFVCCERDDGSEVPVPTNLVLGTKMKGCEDISNKLQMTITEKNKNSNEWGWTRFMKTSSLPNGTFIVQCVITFPTQSVVTTGRFFPIKIPECYFRNNLGAILESESFSDVKLIAQGKVFNVHKIILSAMSPVFAAMFTNELKEKKDGVVEITDMLPDILENMLKFVYSGKLDLEISVEMSIDLLTAADKYGLGGLKCLCEDYLCQKVTVENVLELLVLAYLHNSKQLKGTALEFINSNIIPVRKNVKWKMLVERYPHLLDEIFAHYLLLEEGEM